MHKYERGFLGVVIAVISFMVSIFLTSLFLSNCCVANLIVPTKRDKSECRITDFYNDSNVSLNLNINCFEKGSGFGHIVAVYKEANSYMAVYTTHMYAYRLYGSTAYLKEIETHKVGVSKPKVYTIYMKVYRVQRVTNWSFSRRGFNNAPQLP